MYSDNTSMLTSLQLMGTAVCVIRLANVVVSLMYDGSCLTIGCSQWSTNLEMFSVILFTDETMGLMPIGFLCIFFKKYNWAVL